MPGERNVRTKNYTNGQKRNSSGEATAMGFLNATQYWKQVKDTARADLLAELRSLFVEADSELSAIVHGRTPSDKETLIRLSREFRKLYEGEQIEDADNALLQAGIASVGTMAARIHRLATERDLALAGFRNPRSEYDRCPECGYTELDAREMGDHKLCQRFPFFNFEETQ